MRAGWLVIRVLKVFMRAELSVSFVEWCWIPKIVVTMGVSAGSFVPHILYVFLFLSFVNGS